MNVTPTQEVPRPAEPAPDQNTPAGGVQEKVAEWIGNHPVLLLGTGVVLGAAIGWLVKRKQ